MRVIEKIEIRGDKVYKVTLGAKVTHRNQTDAFGGRAYNIYVGGVQQDFHHHGDLAEIKEGYMLRMKPWAQGTGKYSGRSFRLLPVALQDDIMAIAKNPRLSVKADNWALVA